MAGQWRPGYHCDHAHAQLRTGMNRNVRIVVVEDDAVIAADLAALLGDLGYTVSATCPNARTAMLALARHEPDPPLGAGHLILADPEGNELCLD